MDACETLAGFADNGRVDSERFSDLIGEALARAT